MRQLSTLLATAAFILMVGAAPAAYAAEIAPAQTGVAAPAATATPTPRAPRAGTPVAFPTATPTTAPVTSAATLTPTITAITLTIPTQQPAALTPVASPTVVQLPTATPAAVVTPTVAPPVSTTVTTTAPAAAPAVEGAIGGTVIANRTSSLVRFFAEGNTYTLDGLRSTGLALARPTGVLNLFNCDATLGEAQEGCFWDPYLLQRDGFYEIVSGKDAGALVSLILREAGAPPANQVWIQNRTGVAEEVYFGTQMRQLAAGSVQEFTIDSGGVGVFYLRTCVTAATGDVCEWAAHSAQPGGYYALVEESFSGGLPGTTVTNLELTPVLSSGATVSATVAVEPEQPQTLCRLAVPALNVRSGPGLEFEIVKKVRSSDVEIATVLVVGRTEDGGWLQVDERVATGGWVIAGSEYLTCDGDITALPAIPVEQLPATPTPLPIVEAPVVEAPVVEAPAAPVEGAVDATGAVTESAPAEAAVPAGLARLTVQNSFDREIRFTIDQRYRAEVGPSEYDLQPGQSASFLVLPGYIDYSASSAWQEISGNAQVFLNPEESRQLFIYFYYDSIEELWLMGVQ